GMKNLAAAVLAGLAIALAMPASALADAVATTDPATNVTFTSAQLNGTATTAAGGSYFFEWGTPSTSCKGRPPTPTSSFGSGIQHLSATITNLTPGVTYCFHLVVLPTYEEGRHVGQDQVFTTPLPGAVATTGDATSITDTAARLNGASNTVSLNS